jgi:S-adenosylmethionine synthetase
VAIVPATVFAERALKVQPRRNLFTSESVSMGHPDKIADRIADSILDHILSHDPSARVACELLVTGDHVVVAGEISSRRALPHPQIERLVRGTIERIGYDDPALGFDAAGVQVHVFVQKQSPDIARGVDGDGVELGAGDQGLMFGYATDQTEELMPLPIILAHRLVARHAQVRARSGIPHLRPDAKAQVTVAFEGRSPAAVESVLISTQHGPEWTGHQDELRARVIERIVMPSLAGWWRDGITVHVNPTGRFEIGGPAGDTGLTGRKIIVDTYGGWARHGGGAFSGKDPSKVDRSASYMARYVAKNIVAAGLAAECELRLSYAIGMAEPTAVDVDCLGTGRIPEHEIERIVREVFPLTPSGIIRTLELQRPIYEVTSFHGHFGRSPGPDGSFSWERTDRVDDLRAAAGIGAAAV